jgi:hypothetical protein
MANLRWSKESGQKQARIGQRGLRQKFEREIRAEFPDLDEDEIQRRADSRLKSHMQMLALKSSQARAAKKAGK